MSAELTFGELTGINFLHIRRLLFYGLQGVRHFANGIDLTPVLSLQFIPHLVNLSYHIAKSSCDNDSSTYIQSIISGCVLFTSIFPLLFSTA